MPYKKTPAAQLNREIAETFSRKLSMRKSGVSPKQVKRFVVFSGDEYYPNGGWRDYRSSHTTLKEARSAFAPGDWRHIVDLATGQIILD